MITGEEKLRLGLRSLLAKYPTGFHTADLIVEYLKDQAYTRQPIAAIDGLEDAIKSVQRHQEWRRGAEIPMQSPFELGANIDIVLQAARMVAALTKQKEG